MNIKKIVKEIGFGLLATMTTGAQGSQVPTLRPLTRQEQTLADLIAAVKLRAATTGAQGAQVLTSRPLTLEEQAKLDEARNGQRLPPQHQANYFLRTAAALGQPEAVLEAVRWGADLHEKGPHSRLKASDHAKQAGLLGLADALTLEEARDGQWLPPQHQANYFFRTAARAGNLPGVLEALARGADPNDRGPRSGLTPAGHAEQAGFPELAAFLRELQQLPLDQVQAMAAQELQHNPEPEFLDPILNGGAAPVAADVPPNPRVEPAGGPVIFPSYSLTPNSVDPKGQASEQLLRPPAVWSAWRSEPPPPLLPLAPAVSFASPASQASAPRFESRRIEPEALPPAPAPALPTLSPEQQQIMLDRSLIDAVKRGDYKAAKKALDAGANPNAVDSNGRSAESYVLEHYGDPVYQGIYALLLDRP